MEEVKKTRRVISAEDYPINLLNEVNDGIWKSDIPSDINGTIEYLLQTYLTQREADILHQRFQQGKTCAEIGKEYGLTLERIRQIKHNALRKLREPGRFVFLQKGVSGVIDFEVDNAVEKLNAEKQQKVVVEQQLGGIYNSTLKIMSLADVKSMELYELGLSTRSYNGLKRAGLNTLGDVEKITVKQLKCIRNLGKSSCEEIIGILNKFGITLREDDD